MAMYTISNLLTPKEKAKEISSIVLSNTILAGGKILRFTDLKDPVTMHFQHSKVSVQLVKLNIYCLSLQPVSRIIIIYLSFLNCG